MNVIFLHNYFILYKNPTQRIINFLITSKVHYNVIKEIKITFLNNLEQQKKAKFKYNYKAVLKN